MSLDTTKLAQFVGTSMSSLEEAYPEAELGDVVLIVELKGLTDSDGDPATAIRYACTDERFWVHRGLIGAAYDEAKGK